MSRHDDSVSLRQMLDHAREAREFAVGKSRHDLDTNRLFELAITRLLEIVGEAANRVSAARRAQLAQIDWEGVRGFRNRIVHGYDEINLDIVWTIISDDLPALIHQLEQIVRD
jgi:uncharacterized protein with HEPN domain